MRNVVGVVFRITIWAAAGFLVTAGWGYYSANLFGIPFHPTPIADTLFRLTNPVVAAVVYFYPGEYGLWDAARGNAATYALVGLIVEMIRKHYRLRELSS